MKSPALCLFLLLAGAGLAQERRLAGEDYIDFKNKLAGLEVFKTAKEDAQKRAKQISEKFSGYCVPDDNARTDVRMLDPDKIKFLNDVMDTLNEMAGKWPICREPLLRAPSIPNIPDSRLNLSPVKETKWTRLRVSSVEFLCLAINGNRMLAGSKQGIYYSTDYSKPDKWETRLDRSSDVQVIDTVALTDREAFAGGTAIGVADSLSAAPLNPGRLRWRNVKVPRANRVQALAVSQSVLFASTDMGIFGISLPFFAVGDPGYERIKSQAQRENDQHLYPVLTVEKTGPVGGGKHPDRGFPVLPYRREPNGRWLQFADNENTLGANAVVTALAADGGRIFAGTSQGKVWGRCPLRPGEDTWTEFKDCPFKEQITAIAVGGGSIHVSNGGWIVSSPDNVCESSPSAAAKKRRWESVTGNLATPVHALFYSNGVLFAATKNDIWSTRMVSPAATPKPPPSP